MVKITYIEASGASHIVDVQVGSSVMRGAVMNDVPGIVAECGGSCACGTCRVDVDEAWRERIGDGSDIEAATLEFREDPRPGLRLSCQIKVTEELDGLIVRMPASQY